MQTHNTLQSVAYRLRTGGHRGRGGSAGRRRSAGGGPRWLPPAAPPWGRPSPPCGAHRHPTASGGASAWWGGWRPSQGLGWGPSSSSRATRRRRVGGKSSHGFHGTKKGGQEWGLVQRRAFPLSQGTDVRVIDPLAAHLFFSEPRPPMKGI